MPPARPFAALALLALLACSPDPAPRGAWRQTDLWLLADEVRRSQYATLQRRAVRALEPEPGVPIELPLALGRSARLSFRPLVAPDHRCRFVVSLRGTGDEPAQVVYDDSHGASGATLPEVVEVDLAAWAGHIATLRLGAEAAGGLPCRAFWGSPVVVDRRRDAPPLRGTRVPGSEGRRPNVLLLGADTLRADALGVYGRTPSPTPALDRFAWRSDVWTRAFASINNTNPSFASMMTGLYAKNHRVFNLSTPLPRHHVTLAERLRDAGYDTFAVVSAAHLGMAGLSQGFARFTRPGGQFFAETVVDIAIAWLQEGGERPFFAWLHFFDPHVPHNPPRPYDEGLHPAAPYGMGPVGAWEPFREPGVPKPRAAREGGFTGHPRLYHSEVAYLDRQLDRLLGFLEDGGLLEDTLVVFVADHGETLGERMSFFQHTGLYDETTHVPLIVRWPGQREGRRHAGLVQHFDLFPTVLGALGLPVPEQDGIDLRALARGDGRDAVFANHANARGEMIRTPEHLYLVNRDIGRLPDGPHLYDLREDPRARDDRAGAGLPEERALGARLEQWLRDRRAGPEPQRRVLDAEEREQLRALGYLDE